MPMFIVSLLLMLLAAVLVVFLSLAISRRSHTGFFKLLETHLSSSKSELLFYNVRKDKIRGDSDANSQYNGYNLSQFAYCFADSGALIEAFDKLKSGAEKMLSFVGQNVGGDKYFTLNMRAEWMFGRLHHIDIIMSETKMSSAQAKHLSFSNFRSMFDLVSTGFVICEMDGTVIDFNKATMSIFGIPDKDALLSRNLKIFDTPYYTGPMPGSDISNNGALYIVNVDMSKASHHFFGRSGFASLAFRYYKMNDDGKDYLVVIITDLSNQGTPEFATLLDEQQTILKVSTVGYAIYNLDGVMEYANDAYYDIIGILDKRDYRTRKRVIFDSPVLPDDFKRDIVKNEMTETVCHLTITDDVREYYNTSRTGNLDLKLQCRRVLSADGSKLSYVLCITDITEDERQRRIIDELDRDKEMLMRTAGISTWTVNLETGQRENMNGVKIFPDNYTYEQLFEFVHPGDAQMLKIVFAALRSGELKESRNVVRVKKTSDAQEYSYFELSLVAKEENGIVTKIGCVIRDVTSDALYKQTLEQGKIRTQLTMQEYDLTQFDFDAETGYLTIYQAEEMFDIPTHCTIEDLLKLIHPDDRHVISDLVARAYRHEDFTQTVYFKSKNIKQQGEWYNLQMFVIPLQRNTRGEATVYTGLIRDNTRWIKTMQQEEENNLMLNTFINMVPCLFYMKDVDDGLRYMLVNEQACKWPGFNREDIIGHTDDEVFSNVPSFDTVLERAHDIETIENGYLEYDFTSNVNNEKRVWHTIKSMIKTPSGHRYLFAVSLDVSQLHTNIEKLEATIKETEKLNEMLHTFINSIPGQFFMKSVDNNLAYVMVNDKFCEMTGLKREDIIGFSDAEILNGEFSAKEAEYDQKAIANGNIEYDIHGVNSAAGEVWHTQKTLLTLNGHSYLLATSLDVTQQAETLKELQRAKVKAEESDKLKSAFLANMSHEIRTPLNAIVGFSELLTTTDDPVKRATFSQYVSSNSELLLGLINDILDVSKFEAGYVNFKYEQFSISDLFQEIYDTYQKKIKSDVLFVCDIKNDNCIVEFDKNRMTQIINNFITNSNKYTREGYIKFGYVCENGGVRIFVEDSGIGIPDNKKDRVFSRFEKLDSFAQGTGLGLSICKSIAEAAGGNVGFESEVDRGSKFWAWIPMKVTHSDSSAAINDADSDVPTAQQGVSILVVEDNDSNYFLVETMLSEHSLERARNGQEAVDMAQQKKYDIIFMDVRMPVMDGLEATRQIRKFDAEIPIVALTANSFDSDRDAALEAGCTAYLAKPVRQKDLTNLLAKFANS
ncbi:MAG: response regulator [Salinivirgaceae bacterium]|nr:response regulator [Salinivirgaceae bacterium]